MNEPNSVPFIKRVVRTGGSLSVNFTKEARTLGLEEGDYVKGYVSGYALPSNLGSILQFQQVGTDGSIRPSQEVLSRLKGDESVMVGVSGNTVYFHGIFEEEVELVDGLELLGQDRIIHVSIIDGTPMLTVEPLKTGITIEYSMFDVRDGGRTVSQGLLIKSNPYEVWEPVSKTKEE